MPNIYKIENIENEAEETAIPKAVENIMDTEKYMTLFLSPKTSELYFDMDGKEKFTPGDHIKSLQIIVQSYLEYMYCLHDSVYMVGKKVLQTMINDPNFWDAVEKKARNRLEMEKMKKN